MYKIIGERMTLLLTDKEINNHYQSLPNKDEAEKFIFNLALASLVVPRELR
jgi:hypothetical protein